MKVCDYIAKRCAELNKHTFLFVGGGNMYLANALGKNGVDYKCMHHEQALSMAAEAYARVTGKPSVCIVTTGPGSTNVITGLYGAWVDSIPMLFISGQVRTEVMRRGKIRQIGDQEVNIIDVVKPLTKFAGICKEPKEIGQLMNKALYEASTKRQGPTWLDIPLDVQNAPYEEIENAPMSSIGQYRPASNPNINPFIEACTLVENAFKTFTLLKQAKRPIIIAGSGIRSAQAIETFWKVMSKLHIPAIPSFNARDLGPFHYPAFGMLGCEFCNNIIDKSDLILILGCRMNIRQIGWEFGKMGHNATKIMVDIDPEELNKHTFKPDIKIEADVGDFLAILDSFLTKEYTNQWAGDIRKESIMPNSNYVSPVGLAKALNKFTEMEEIVVFANGLYPPIVSQELEIKKDMRLILNSGCGAMGYGLPAAIGAAFASGRRIICLEGDGSIQLNIQELQTLVHHNLPIKVFIGNNGGYNSIKNTQDRYFDGFYVGADAQSGISFPNFGRLAKAYEIKYVRIRRDADLEGVIKRVLQVEGPIICELNLDPKFMLEKAKI